LGDLDLPPPLVGRGEATSGSISYVIHPTNATGREATRLVTVQDAAALTELVCRNRKFMAPWDPVRPEEFFSLAGQAAVVGDLLDGHARGVTLPQVILDSAGQVAGRITGSIVRGPFQSCGIGYWVSQDRNGQGLASAAVAHIKLIAFGELHLHRLQAETLEHNIASRRVLERNGFEKYGLAPAYLNIAGRWQDHVMFQLIGPADQLAEGSVHSRPM
jgi:ribosomal-protein-alanine N-acetyltransferase